MTTICREIRRFDELEAWSKALARIASEPLACCPAFPEIAARFERWWSRGATDRPVVMGAYNAQPDRPVTRRLDLLHQPEAWLSAKQRDLSQLRPVGDALPSIRADLGPAALGPLLGAPARAAATEDTVWTDAFIDDDWSNVPDWNLREDNVWWRTLRRLVDRVVEDARGRYLVCLPDIGGAPDALLNMRGAERLCLDVLEQPARIVEAVEQIYPAWRRIIQWLYDRILRAGCAPVHWLGVWSSEPYVLPTCDFNYMLGPEHFRQLLLPGVAHLTETTGRALFHLDGPAATRHAEALLELPHLHAIQFTPGTGTPSALVWVDMFRAIQRRGRSVLVVCPAHEALSLCEHLEPEGLALILDGPGDAITSAYGKICERYGA